MRIYNSLEEIKKDIVVVNRASHTLKYNGDITINFNLQCRLLKIDVRDIYALNIDVMSVSARDVDVRNLNVFELDVRNLDARDVNAVDVVANDILYKNEFFARNNIACASISGRYKKSKHYCLLGKITLRK